MSDPACTIDVPVVINKKQVLLHVTPSHVQLMFGKSKAKEISVSFDNIQHTIYSPEDERLGLHMKNAQTIVPGTKKPVKSIVICGLSAEHANRLFSQAVQASNVTATACGRAQVSHEPVAVVWTDRTCTCVPDIDYVVLQRTMGGMSTFDAHIVPKHGSIVTVEMIPHEHLDMWRARYAEKVLDLGPDPITNASLERLRKLPGGIADAFTVVESADEESDMSCSDDEAYEQEEDSSESDEDDDDALSVMSSSSESAQDTSSCDSENEQDSEYFSGNTSE